MAIMAKERRYSLPPYTRGWFAVGWSDELRKGEVKKVRQFGQSFTLFRGEDGAAGVLDDICPHLGAHFSDGGTVEGNSVRCPYHHWCFDRHGECSRIPYAKKIPVKAKVRSYSVVERYGMIFMYRDKDGNPPSYDLPRIENFDEKSYLAPAKFNFAIRIHGQDIMENSVDSAHFRAVHGHETPENIFLAQGEELRITQIVTLKRFLTTIKGHLDFHMIEPGFHYVHFPEAIKVRALVFSSIVPIDEEMTNHRMSIWINKTPIPGFSRLVQRFIISEMMRTYREDMQIWESKEYLPHPVLCDGDGSIMKLRRWYSQFYDTPVSEMSAFAAESEAQAG